MRHILLLSHSLLLEKYAMLLRTVMLGHLFPWLFAVMEDTSPIPLLTRNPNVFIAARMGLHSRGYNLFDLGRCHFTIIFDLNGEQEATPIFTSQGKIFLLIILQLILHG